MASAMIAASASLEQPYKFTLISPGQLLASAMIAASVSLEQPCKSTLISPGQPVASAMSAASVRFLQLTIQIRNGKPTTAICKCDNCLISEFGAVIQVHTAKSKTAGNAKIAASARLRQ